MRWLPLMMFAAISTSAAQPPNRTAAQLDSVMRDLAVQGFSGVVRIEQGGSTLLERGYGLANRAQKTPFSASTVVQIGSNTKDFTVVALLQLQERGKLALTDSLARFFPNAPADKRVITLAQLMNHTAGFPIGLGGDFDAVTREQFLQTAFARRLDSPPGAREQYSNTGFALLAAVIETVSGTSYDEYVRDNILRPLGIKDTGFLLPQFDPKRFAHGYRGGVDQGAIVEMPHAADGPYWNLRGNGGMVSTVGDMHTFYKAVFESNTLLRAESRTKRFNPDAPIGLAGSDLVNFFIFERLPREQIELIVATNSAEFRAPRVLEAIRPILGLPNPQMRGERGGGARQNAKAPSAAAAALVTEFIAVVNGANAAALTTFIGQRFDAAPNSPTVPQRVARMGEMHTNLGVLTVTGMDEIAPNIVDVSVTTANEGPATLKIFLEPGSTLRIKSIQVLVGG
jgi:CubicO group peptidase (beta-lactamase class C family)